MSRNLQINSLLLLLVDTVPQTNVNKLRNQVVTISLLHAIGIQTSVELHAVYSKSRLHHLSHLGLSPLFCFSLLVRATNYVIV